jgi:Family of unknown function (DUF6090)
MKLFRKIRHKLLADGKVSQYLKYAIGEIILVVIGILIALSINNWNHDRLLKKEEFSYYQNIKRQLTEDSHVIESNINFNNYYYDQYQYAIQLIQKEDRNNLDTLAIIAVNLLEYSDFHQETNIYQTLVSSGEIKLLNNQQIIDGLQRLEENYIYINKIENGHFEIIKMIYSDLNKIIRLNPLTIEKPDLFFGFEFQNHFTLASEIMTEKDEIYHKTLDEINRILAWIDIESHTKS